MLTTISIIWGRRRIALLVLFVDNLYMTSDHVEKINWLQEEFKKQFSTTDLESLCHSLGIEFIFQVRNYYDSKDVHKNYTGILSHWLQSFPHSYVGVETWSLDCTGKTINISNVTNTSGTWDWARTHINVGCNQYNNGRSRHTQLSTG
jgi:hypothetical protein